MKTQNHHVHLSGVAVAPLAEPGPRQPAPAGDANVRGVSAVDKRKWPAGIALGIALLAIGPSAHAQLLGQHPKPYAEVGSHWSSATTSSPKEARWNARLGFRFGVGVRLEASPSLSTLLALSFDRRNVRRTYTGTWYRPGLGEPVSGTWVHEVSASYLSASLRLRWSPFREAHLFLGGGPQVGIPVSATGRRHWSSAGDNWTGREELNYLGSPQFDILAETGLELLCGSYVLAPTALFTIGLTEVHGDDGSVGQVKMGLSDSKHRSFGLSLGVRKR